MKSKELAQFANVSIRTLRHYHSLGLLEEPPRNANGYREYRATDAVRLLRIKHLASLGFSLQQIKDLLDGDSPAASTEEALDQLDAELAEEAKAIEEKRAMIRALRESHADPDIPLPFSAHLQRLREEGASPHMMELERSGLCLANADAEVSQHDIQTIAKFLELLSEKGRVRKYVQLTEAVYSIRPDTPAEEQEALVEEFAQWFANLLRVACKNEGWSLEEFAELMNADGSIYDSLDRETMTPVQIKTSDKIIQRACQLLS